MLVDEGGVARLEVRSMRDIDKHRCSAPDTTSSKYGCTPSFLSAKEDDVYGMGMITYEASSQSRAKC